MFFFLICAWTDGWTNDPDAGNLRRQHAHYNVTVIVKQDCCPVLCPQIQILKHMLPQGRACCFNCHIPSGLKINRKRQRRITFIHHYFTPLFLFLILLIADATKSIRYLIAVLSWSSDAVRPVFRCMCSIIIFTGQCRGLWTAAKSTARLVAIKIQTDTNLSKKSKSIPHLDKKNAYIYIPKLLKNHKK